MCLATILTNHCYPRKPWFWDIILIRWRMLVYVLLYHGFTWAQNRPIGPALTNIGPSGGVGVFIVCVRDHKRAFGGRTFLGLSGWFRWSESLTSPERLHRLMMLLYWLFQILIRRYLQIQFLPFCSISARNELITPRWNPCIRLLYIVIYSCI